MSAMNEAQEQQGTHFWFMAAKLGQNAADVDFVTDGGTFTPPTGMTRKDSFIQFRDRLGEQYPGAHLAVLAFDIQPNQL